MAPAVLDSSLAADASAGQTPQPEAAPEGVSKATSREGDAEDQGPAQGPVSKEGKTKITVDNKDKDKGKDGHGQRTLVVQ